MKLINLLALLFLLAKPAIGQPPSAVSQQYRPVHWDTENGLAKIRWHESILRDYNGFVWFGSSHGELSRFDGNSFKHYDPDKSIAGTIRTNACLSMVEDSLHNIWIGTFIGLSRYDIRADTFTNLPVSTVIHTGQGATKEFVVPFWATSEEVFCIEADTYITSYNIHSLARKKLLTLGENELSGNGVKSSYTIYESSTNSIWMLLGNGEGLLQISLNDARETFFRRDSYLMDFRKPRHRDSEAMVYDKKRGCIWINSHDGLTRFSLDDHSFQQPKVIAKIVDDNPDYDRFVGIDLDQTGKVWLATEPLGILIYDPDNDGCTPLFKDEALARKVADGNLKIYCAPDGIIWTSYWTLNGIYQLLPYSPAATRYIGHPENPDSLKTLNIVNMLAADNRHLWIGTPDKGMAIYDLNSEKFKTVNFRQFPGIKGPGIVPLYIDTVRKKAWLIAGQPEQVYELDMQSRSTRLLVLKDDQGRMINPGSIMPSTGEPYQDGFLFYDAEYGIFQVTGDSAIATKIIGFDLTLFRMVNMGDSILFLKSIPKTRTYRKHGNSWVLTPCFLDSILMADIIVDKVDHSIWVGTDKSIIHYTSTFRQIRSYENGNDLFRGLIALVADGQGNIWFNNDRKMVGSLNRQTGIVKVLSDQDGYHNQLYDIFTAIPRLVGNELFFVGNALAPEISLTKISAAKFVSSPPSRVYLRSLVVKDFTLSLPATLNNVEELSLKHFQNMISLEVGSLDFYSNGKNYIRYRIENLSPDWQYIPVNSSIHYEGLPPGKYKLMIQSSNAGNEFNGPTKTLMITIHPAFWNTWWFRAAMILAALSLLYGYVQYRSQALKNRNLVLEKKVSQRTNELRTSLSELKLAQDQLIQSEKMASLGELTSGIAHEIKNPLNFINNFSEINTELITDIEDQINALGEAAPTQLQQYMKTLQKNSEKIMHHGKRIDGIVKGMLQHSRQANRNKERTNINLLCEEALKLAYHGFKAKEKSFNSGFETRLEANLPDIMVIPQDISRVLLNLINNAFYAVNEKKKQLFSEDQEEESEGHYKPLVTVATRLSGSRIIVTVEDNGSGIPASIINKIYQPFFTTKPTGEGTGLGLSMSYDIITKGHGGELKVTSREGEGTNFEISLPLNN